MSNFEYKGFAFKKTPYRPDEVNNIFNLVISEDIELPDGKRTICDATCIIDQDDDKDCSLLDSIIARFEKIKSSTVSDYTNYLARLGTN